MTNAINSLNPNSGNFSISGKNGGGNKLTGRVGDMLSAVIEQKGGGNVRLNFSGALFNFPETSVKGEVGDSVLFEVTNAANGKISLKQVFTGEGFQQNLMRQVKTENTKEILLHNNFIEEVDAPLAVKSDARLNAERREHLRQAVAAARAQINGAANNTTRAALAQLAANGININKLGISELNSVVLEIETTGLPLQQEHSIAALEDGDLKAQALKALEMPVSEKNVYTLSDVEDKIKAVGKPSQGEIVSVLYAEKELTLENLYKAKFQENPERKSVVKNIDPPVWEDLAAEVNKFFAREGIEVTPENVAAAKFLLANDIGLTGNNMAKYEFLSKVDLTERTAELLLAAAKNVKEGKLAASVNVADGFVVLAPDSEPDIAKAELLEKYKNAIRDLPKITLDHIEMAIRRQIPVTLANLLAMKDLPLQGAGSETAELQAVTALRQLAEIQIKLTYDAAYRMASKGIDINVVPLEDALAQLKETEAELHAKALKLMGAEDTPANKAAMARTYDTVNNLAFMTYQAFAYAANGAAAFTANALSNLTSENLAAGGYGVMATVPNLKYGDRFRLVEEQIVPLLEEMGIEPTERAVRAAAILSKNERDITAENIVVIKDIDAKVDALRNNLHPAAAAKIIAEGLSPVDMDINDILAKIEQFEQQYGTTEGERLAETIAELDRMGNSEWYGSRQAVMGVYKILHQLQKDGGKALGAFLETGAELTLKNLLTMSKGYNTAKKTEAGQPSQFVKVEQSYAKSLISEFVRASTPSAVEIFAAETGLAQPEVDVSVEKATQRLNEINAERQVEATEKMLEQSLVKLSQIQQTPASSIKFMAQTNVPMTVMNTMLAASVNAKPGFLSKTINALDNDETNETNEISEISEKIPDTDLAPLKEGVTVNEVVEQLNNVVETAGVTGEAFERIDAVKRALALTQSVNAAADMFYLPVKFNGSFTDIHVYVKDGGINEQNGITMMMSLNLNFGAVDAAVTVKDGKVWVTFSGGTNQDALRILKDNVAGLTESLAECGLEAGKITFM